MTGEDRSTVAVFRPDDDRLAAAVELLDDLGVDPLPDPMLGVEPTGAVPRTDADFVVLTSKTGVELAAGLDWKPGGATLCAIGDATADALETAGYEVGTVPDEFSSRGLVRTLDSRVAGTRVEVARSDHGSQVLLDGLDSAGAYVHETILYELVRPDRAGGSAEAIAAGEVDAALFTSSLTVEHFLEAAAERGMSEDVIAGLEGTVVGTIGMPTRKTAEAAGIDVGVVPDQADFGQLAKAAVELLSETR